MSEHAPEQGPEELTPSQEIADVLCAIGERYGFDPETCNEIANQPFEEALPTAYDYLMQAGLEADEVLSRFLEQPEETE